MWEGSYVIDDIEPADDLAAFSGSTSVTGDLTIEYLSLISLERLKCLTDVGEILSLRDNDTLTTLKCLENLQSVDLNFGILGNDELCTGLAQALRDQVTIGGTSYIDGNDDGC